jgi:hypothetical protein
MAKLRSPYMVLLAVLLGLTILLLLFNNNGVLLLPAPANYVALAQARIKIGEGREIAVSKLNDATRHFECHSARGAVDDLFFYGTSNPDNAVVILVRSDYAESKLFVSFIGPVKNYLLQEFYGECLGLESPP